MVSWTDRRSGAYSYSDDEMGEASASEMAASDALLLGRVTYEHLAAYWPDQPGGEPMVDYLNCVPKYVVSGTLEEPLKWNNSAIIRGNMASYHPPTNLHHRLRSCDREASISGPPSGGQGKTENCERLPVALTRSSAW